MKTKRKRMHPWQMQAYSFMKNIKNKSPRLLLKKPKAS